MKNCVGTISITKPKGVLIQYADVQAGPWSETLNTATTKWIRFSKDDGAHWSNPKKFVGEDGAPGSDAASAIILYNGLNPTDGLDHAGTFNKTFNVPANTLENDGDVLKITAILELGGNSNSDVLYTIGIYHTEVLKPKALSTIEIVGTVDGTDAIVKLEAYVNRIDATNFFVEYMAYRQGQSGVLEDTPNYYGFSGDFSASDPLTIVAGIVDGTDELLGTGGNVTNLKQLKVELYRILV